MNYVKELDIKDIVINALKEDIGKKDITTELIIPKNKLVKAALLVKENSVVCGLGVASLAFKLQDKNIRFKSLVSEGDFVKKGKIIARLSGRATSVLTAERVALNFLCLLSGISTQTRKFVDAVKPYKTKIMDTRKTIPGLRILEKYAVRIGGGYNHRFSLDEMVLIKDNHLRIINPKSQFPNSKQIPNPNFQIPNLEDAIKQIRKNISNSIRIEVEVKNLKEFKEALKLKPDIIMLDNMSIKDMKKAVKIRNHLRLTTYDLRLTIEASGNITLKNVRKVAATGVDFISIGELTHSVDSVDISLEII